MQAEMLCVPLTNPIWLIKTRMQAQTRPIAKFGPLLDSAGRPMVPYRNVSGTTINAFLLVFFEASFAVLRLLFDLMLLLGAFRRIVAKEGVLALYKEVLPALILTSHGAIKVHLYFFTTNTRLYIVFSLIQCKLDHKFHLVCVL